MTRVNGDVRGVKLGGKCLREANIETERKKELNNDTSKRREMDKEYENKKKHRKKSG
jgi:hypothetical protein